MQQQQTSQGTQGGSSPMQNENKNILGVNNGQGN